MINEKTPEEKISAALDVEYLPKQELIKTENLLTKVKIQRKDQVRQDFDSARKNMKELISLGFNAIDGIMKVADAGDSPRAYEVASILETLRLLRKLFGTSSSIIIFTDIFII